MKINTTNKIIIPLFIRWLLGFIFLMQGGGKVIRWGIENVHQQFFAKTFEGLLPSFLTYFTAYYTSYVELIGGLFLIIGFQTRYTLYALASVLIMVTIGHGIAEPIWDLSHVMYRSILLITLLFIPTEWDCFSMDYVLKKLKR